MLKWFAVMPIAAIKAVNVKIVTGFASVKNMVDVKRRMNDIF